MSDSFIQVPIDSLGKQVDTAQLPVGGQTVQRQRIVIGDNSATAQFATVTAGALLVTGTVSLGASTANIGTINNISAAVVLAAGAANVGTINNISATVVTGLSYVIEKTSNSQVQVGDSANAAIRVNIVAGAAAGGTAQTDRAAFTEATTALTPAGGVFSDVRSAVAEDAVAALRITNQAGLHVNLRNAAGAEYTAANPLSVKVENQSATLNVQLVAGTALVGAVSLAAGTANIGFINGISAPVVLGAETALIGAISIAAGTSNIGFINGISATVTIAGRISLGAGTANFGTLNDISRTVEVHVSTPFTINNISATSVVGLSYVTDLTSGAQVVVGDSLNSAIRVHLVADDFASGVIAVMSTSHGPKSIVCSVSANTSLIVSPGGGISVYVTQLAVSNHAASYAVQARIGTSASASTIQMYLAPNGGGFVMNFDPPWKLSASEAAICSVKPGGSDCYFNVNFYVAA